MTISSARSSFLLAQVGVALAGQSTELRGHVALGGEDDGRGQVAHRAGAGDLQAVEAGQAFLLAALQVVQVRLRLVGGQLVLGLVPSSAIRRM